MRKQKYPNHQIVSGNEKSGVIIDTIIFNNNPNIKRFSKLKNTQTIWIDSYSGHRPYFIKETEEKYYWNINHKVAIGELYFSEEEKQFASNIISNAKEWWGKEKNIKYIYNDNLTLESGWQLKYLNLDYSEVFLEDTTAHLKSKPQIYNGFIIMIIVGYPCGPLILMPYPRLEDHVDHQLKGVHLYGHSARNALIPT